MIDIERPLRRLLPALLALLLAPRAASAADSASLQFTVPAPNPVQAGERIALQGLAVNSGANTWTAGSYYWVAQIYDLEFNLIARTDQISPPEDVLPGGIASISVPFPIPDTMVGRKLYKLFLVKDSKTLVESEYKPFQVIFRPIPPAPDVVDYRVEGNVTVSYKNASSNGFTGHSGATTLNVVGKVKQSSYLFNAYFLHEVGDIIDPFIILFTYYAPWGTIYGGDISPTVTQFSVNGQGMRGVMLEQRKKKWKWAVLGGQTVDSQAGTATTNGRFARTLYALKAARTFGKKDNFKATANYFLSSDESGSLGSSPNEPNYRGPSLVPQKNSGLGLAISYDPVPRTKILIDYQQNIFYEDAASGGKKDAAWKGELRWERKLFKLQTYVQRAGADFVAFGAPSMVGDRMTFAATVNMFPVPWYTLSLGGNQYTDNLADDPNKTTITQRIISTAHSFQLRSGTNLSLSMSLNTAVGKPQSALDNQTTIVGAGVSQSFGRHSVGLSAQLSRFQDKNDLADDLDTITFSFSSAFSLPRSQSASFGVSRSETKNKVDGSKQSTLSVSPSWSRRFRSDLVGQVWGTMTRTKNTSPTLPSDTSTISFNTEGTWSKSKRLNLTLGLGYNSVKDKVRPVNDVNEATIATRISYSF